MKAKTNLATHSGSQSLKAQATKEAKQVGPLQTLDRGLQALTFIANHGPGLSVAELAEHLGIHRTIAYRLAATLEAHGLVARGPKGALRLGAGIIALSSRFEPQLRDVAQPLLDRLANETSATAFISVPQGEECVAIFVREPQNTPLHVAYRLGSRHPLALGAAGIAILAGRPERPSDPEAVRQARKDGFSLTRGQVQPGAVGVACPLHEPNSRTPSFEASLGVVTLGEADVTKLVAAVKVHARKMRMILKAGAD